MNMSPSLTNVRSSLTFKFFSLRMRALRDLALARLTGGSAKLATFPEQTRRENPNRSLIGIQEIAIEQIAGTLNRESDFDYKFRPLKKHLLNRWVNVHILLERESWPPILVHKIGGKYYVEDGHHRVSIARSNGVLYIEARVWEYHTADIPENACLRINCGEQSRSVSRAYATR